MTNIHLITIEGWISDYWEQGMERMPDLIFQDKNYCKNRNEGWKLDGIHVLQPGQTLVIFDDENNILWDGDIRVRKSGFLGFKKIFPNQYEWCPENIEHETWRSWFKRKPPLKARLTFSDELKK